MQMGDHRARAARSRAAVRPFHTTLTGFEWFILGLIVAMLADVVLFVWIVAHEFAR
jgi:hypothetical protein